MRSSLRRIAREYAPTRHIKSADEVGPLLEYIPRVSPEIVSPVWMEPITSALERARYEPLRVCFSAPPQHGKSTVFFHWIPWLLEQLVVDVQYITYNERFAFKQLRRARRVANRAGLRFADDDHAATSDWNLASGASVMGAGIEGGITGNPGGAIACDDLYRNWKVAQSRTYRDQIDNEFMASVVTRTAPRTPIVVVATRWHEDDQTARLLKRGFTLINLPAINDAGEALSPLRPIEYLKNLRDKELADWLWWAMYQGVPRSLTGRVFHRGPEWFDKAALPLVGRFGIGLDFAYTDEKRNDRSYSILGRKCGSKLYVVSVTRKQVEAPEFVGEVKAHKEFGRGCPARWYHGGAGEKGIGSFFLRNGVAIEMMSASSDKFTRAVACAAAWNRGDILLPLDSKDATHLYDEIKNFTGSGDEEDDGVDALVALWDLLDTPQLPNDPPPPERPGMGVGLASRLRGAM